MCLLLQITGLGRLSFEEVIPLAFIILNVWKYYFQFDWLIKLYTISSLLFYSRWYYYYSTVIKPPEFMPACIFRQWMDTMGLTFGHYGTDWKGRYLQSFTTFMYLLLPKWLHGYEKIMTDFRFSLSLYIIVLSPDHFYVYKLHQFNQSF